jgi:DNA-binding NtrC family response regulator
MVVVATGPLDAQGAVCLLVDDDATLRRGSARALSDAGFHVVEAGTAEAARREIDALGEALRLVISDLVLGGEDGATLLRYARQTSPKVTTLVVSGYYDTGAVDMTTLGPLLRKPYTGKVLARAALDALAAKPSEALVDDAPTPLTLAASPIGQCCPRRARVCSSSTSGSRRRTWSPASPARAWSRPTSRPPLRRLRRTCRVGQLTCS